MPKITAPAKVQPAAQDAMFISYTPQGAVPPSEKAGLDYAMEMAVDAINFHENGDDEDGPCCTGDNPCQTRIFLVGRQRDLAKQILTAREDKLTPTVDETPRTPAGNGSGSARPVADPASPKQIAYIETLAKQHDTSKIGTFPARTLAQIQNGEEVSKGRASKLIEVLKRQPKQVEEIHNATTPAGPAASAAQLGFLRTLASEQGEEVRTSYTKQEASDEISRLLKAREEAPKAQVRTGSKVTEDGMYQTSDGTVYKVQIAKQGSGRLYAKQLTEHKTENGSSWSFEYVAGAIHRLNPADKMSLEQAQEFGKLYGVCCRCAADLTDEASIERGMGPICAEKM